MKPSNISWVGEIPCSWDVFRGKDVLTSKRLINSAKQESNILSLTLRGVRRNDPESPIGLVPSDYASYQIFEENDLVFKLIDLENIRTSRIGLVKERGIMSPAYVRLTPKNPSSAKFLAWYFIDLWNRDVFQSMGGCGVRSSLSSSELMQQPLPQPPLIEQIAIAAYLDKATATIDKQRDLLERKKALLQEHKKAVIHEAVTKGLKPGVQMKPSGVDWIECIPCHWQIARCESAFSERIGRGSSSGRVLTVSIANGIMPQHDYEALTGRKLSTPTTEKDNYKFVAVGDLVYNKMRMWQGAVAASDFEGVVSPAYVVLKPLKNIHHKFAEYQLRSALFVEQSNLYSYGIVDDQNSLRYCDFKAMTIALPPLAEQLAIATFLDQSCQLLDRQCELIDRKIELLGKLRESTIHEAVTKGVPASAV